MIQSKPIPGHPGYTISNIGGKVVSYKRRNPRVLKTWVDKGGGENAFLFGPDKKYHCHNVGHLVLLAWIGPCPPGQQCRHGPRGRRCHDLSNLCWGTKEENSADKTRDGTDARGENNGRSKLTERDVLDIRDEYFAGGVSVRQLADRHKCTKTNVHDILRRKLWRHI
jgi:hypothetical protein